MNYKIQMNQQGSTLIEILAALTIISIALLSLVQIFPQTATYVAKNQNDTTSIYLANGVMNFLQKQDYFLFHSKLTREITEDKPFLKFTSKDIDGQKVTISANSNAYTVNLFRNSSAVSTIFNPTINGKKYDQNIIAYLAKSNSQKEAILQDLKNNNLQVIEKKNTNDIQQSIPNADLIYLYVYVDLNPQDSFPGVLLEGSMKNNGK